MEIWAAGVSGKLRSYLNQTEQANWTYNALYFTLCKSERHFRSKDQAPSHGARHSGAGPPKFFVALPNFVVSRKICLKHIIKTKIFSLKNAFFPQTLKPDYVPAKNDRLGESC